jgi:dihydrofolate reductase
MCASIDAAGSTHSVFSERMASRTALGTARRDPQPAGPGSRPVDAKVVFSTTLSAVQGNARLVSGGLAEELERLRAEPGQGEIAIGGATLAAEVAAAGLVDEYRAMVYPVLVGGGVPFFPRGERRVVLELVEAPGFNSGVVYLRYRVVS